MSWHRILRFGRAARDTLPSAQTDDSASDVLVQITLPMVIVLAVWTVALAQEAEQKRNDMKSMLGPYAQREHVELIKEVQRMRLLRSLEQFLADKRNDLGLETLPASSIVDTEGRVTSERFKSLATHARAWLGGFAGERDFAVVSDVYITVLKNTAGEALPPIVDCTRSPARGPDPPWPCTSTCEQAPLTADAPDEVLEAIHRTHREGQERNEEQILENNRAEICKGIVRGLASLYGQITSVQDRVTNELAEMYLQRGVDAYRKLLVFNPDLKTVIDSLSRSPTVQGGQDPVFEQLRVALRCQLQCQGVPMLPEEPAGYLKPCRCPGKGG